MDGRQAPISSLRLVGVADPDQANVAPAIVTLDVTATVDRGGIGARSNGRTDHRAGRNADAESDTKTRVSLGVAAGCNEAANEGEGRERGAGDFRLGQHGSLHPFESGAAKLAAYPLVAGGERKVQAFEKL